MNAATAAAVGQAAMRRDPMAMLPFCGYNVGDYWKHWLKIGRNNVATPPRIFRVNWFRKDDNGKFIWPGFGDNMRVLKWIVDRVRGRGLGIESPLGWVPSYEELNWTGLEDFPKEKFYEIMAINRELARQEVVDQEDWFTKVGEHLPLEMELERDRLISRLNRTPDTWELKSVTAA